MCNQAAYLGDRPAAPVLLAMMERQEGFAGGYYSGLATLADGQLHHAKVVGDMAALRAETGAADLPGTIGLAHSRSNSGGDVEWGHPFLDCAGRAAYVANGHLGLFENPEAKNNLAERLLGEGHVFRSRTPQTIEGNGTAPQFADGSCCHLSELMAHLIDSLVAAGRPPGEAMRQACLSYPGEVAGLLLHADAPDCIIATRISQPLVVGRGADGTYVATTAYAFPDGLDWVEPLPACATAVVRRDRIELLPLTPPPGPVPTALPWPDGYRLILDRLADGEPVLFGDLIQAVAPLWTDQVAPQQYRLVYEVIDDLAAQGRLSFEVTRVPGATAERTAPRWRMRLLASGDGACR